MIDEYNTLPNSLSIWYRIMIWHGQEFSAEHIIFKSLHTTVHYNDVSNLQRLHCLINCWFRRRWKKTSKLRVTGLCAGNSPVAGEFPAQKASNAENVSIWWRHHEHRAVDMKNSLTITRNTSVIIASECTLFVVWIVCKCVYVPTF